MSKLLEILEEKLGKEVFTEDVIKEVKAELDVVINEKVQEKVLAEKTLMESEKEEFKLSLEDQYRVEADEYKTDLIENIDSYLEYGTQEFFKENKIAIESEFKVKAAEELIEAVCAVMEANHFQLTPATDKAIGVLNKKLKLTEDKLNQVVKENIELSKEVKEYQKALRFKKLTEGLTKSKIEKAMDLMEGLEFSDMKDFDKKVKIIVEKVSKGNTQEKKDIIEEKIESEKITSEVDRWL